MSNKTQPSATQVKNFISRNIGKLTIEQMAATLNVPALVIRQFLPR